MDVVHRAVGKPGVVLVGEGSPNRLPSLLAAEKKRVSRVAFDVPIYDLQVGDVIVAIKDNTPVTRADLELFFEDVQADRRTWQAFEQVEKGHGRLERRQITTSPDLNDYLRHDWGEVGQVFRLQRERSSKKSVVLSLMDLHQVSNVARQIRRFVSHPDEALAWVL